jgi:hypothetical protein
MAATYLTADDFLSGITGEAVDYSLPTGGTIQLRALSFVEAARIGKLRDDEGALNRAALRAGIITPALTDAQLDRLMDGSAGLVAGIVRRIMQLSGMVDDDDLKNAVGGGS